MQRAKLSNFITLLLNKEKALAEGVCDAFFFAKRCSGDLSQIRQKIASIQESFKENVSDDTDLETVYQQGFLEGLIGAIEVVETPREKSKNFQPSQLYSVPIDYYLALEGHRADGRANAFSFTLECDGDVAQLEAEIQKVESYLADSSWEAMQPTATPGVNARGYVAGLKDVLQMLKNPVA